MEFKPSEGRTCQAGARRSCDGRMLGSAGTAGPRRAGPGQARPVGPEGRLQFRPWVSAEAPRSPPHTLARTPGVGRVEGVGWGEMVDLYV